MLCLPHRLLWAALTVVGASSAFADGMSQSARPDDTTQQSVPAAASVAPAAKEPTVALRQQRADFKLAWRAAPRGDRLTLARYLVTLKDYPLFPYLRYAYLEA